MSIHTPADNQVNAFLTDFFARKRPRLVRDVVDQLRTIPEYHASALNKTGPMIITGSPDSRAGKIMVDMTGGTEGPLQVLEKLSQAGVGTVVCMHYSEKHRGGGRQAPHQRSDSRAHRLRLPRPQRYLRRTREEESEDNPRIRADPRIPYAGPQAGQKGRP